MPATLTWLGLLHRLHFWSFGQGLHAQIDAAFAAVEAEDFHFHLVTDVHNFAGMLDIIVAQFADVNQPFAFGTNADKRAERFQASDFAFVDLVGL